MHHENSNFFGSVIVVIFIFAVMFSLNYLMPLHRDDYDYSMIWSTTEHINSLSDVFTSAINHYFLHGGRLFTVFCLDLFLWLGKFYFDVANALMFVALVVLIYFHARRDLNFSAEPIFLATTGLLAWLSFPHFGEVAIWKSGSTVYLWSAVPALIFLLPYNLKLADKFKLDDKKFFVPIIFFLGIISGCSVENLAVTLTILTAGISFYFFKKNSMPFWMPAGFFGSFIGTIILIAAPGNYVRFDEQDKGKGILSHIGTLIAGNAEMILYLLPVILLLFCAYKILKISAAKKFGVTFRPSEIKFGRGHLIMSAVIFILVVSYFCGGIVSKFIRNAIIFLILSPLGFANEKVIERFSHVMDGFEEMAIYWLIVFLIYSALKKFLGISKKSMTHIDKKISASDVLKNFPQIKYSIFLFALAIFNNFLMVAAPHFPARATFSSVIMILVGTISILRLKPVREKFSEVMPQKILTFGAFAIGGFTIISALIITNALRHENDIRVEQVIHAGKIGQEIVEMKPIEIKNRALRHVFFSDFDNGVTKDGLCKFYGIKDIKVEK